MKFDRRSFLASVSATLACHNSRLFADQASSGDGKLSVAAIGHTGRGNFGHGLDTVWLHLPETEVIAASDPDQAGLAAELRKLNIERGFLDYRQMLAEVRPDIVAVCPRHAAACNERKVKLAVAHRNRYHPTLGVIDRLIADGKIGRLLEIRGRGKGDRRGGAEDLWVLGTHVLNLMAYFGGAPTSCSGVLLNDGRKINRHDVKEGAEGLGPMGGNEVHARYEMSRGVVGYFDSIANDGTKSAGFGLQLVGSEGIVNIQCDKHPLAWLCPGNPFAPTKEPRPWIPISTAGVGLPEPRDDLSELVSHHGAPARDLVLSIREDRQPVCNLAEGALTVEMVCAVFESHRLGSQAVEFPLKERENSLTNL